MLLAGVVQELHIERSAARIVGNIYLGKVVRIAGNAIGVRRHRARACGVFACGRYLGYRQVTQEKPLPIERLIHEGETLLVQVVKDPIGSKGARLSTQVSIAGRMLVYLPQDPHIGISQRIENEEERTQLREMLQRLVPPDERGGYIIRTSAEDARSRPCRRP